MSGQIVYIDAEISARSGRIVDLGALREDNAGYHGPSVRDFYAFVRGAGFVCGHNVVHHDLAHIVPHLPGPLAALPVDTLYLSPILFPGEAHHNLPKDEKLTAREKNNPLIDARKARVLLHKERDAFMILPERRQQIYAALLGQAPEFQGFFAYLGCEPPSIDVEQAIREEYAGLLCENAPIAEQIASYPVELAYVLALAGCEDYHAVMPPWVVRNYPRVGHVMKLLRGQPCEAGCPYCEKAFGIHAKLKEFFGYDEFRTYDGKPLQEQAVRAAVEGKSLLGIFPTGGGKSLTFQLPALMAGQAMHGLTLVISPLLSLMKDQVDNMSKRGLVDAVSLNGLLDPVERAEVLRRVRSGLATILYLAPEQLRSPSIRSLLLDRDVVRVVVDEAHCVAAWGHDFRVDYYYIGEFLQELQRAKQLPDPIPVSCFTATATSQVVEEICGYFQEKANVTMETFASSVLRENLRYHAIHCETEEDRYEELRSLLARNTCPTIVYVPRVKDTADLAQRLTRDGFPALPFNGKMDREQKVRNQNAFMCGNTRIIVATCAFGMGVDKKDIGQVIHYRIPSSLEDYMQESGRAGRDLVSTAECYLLFNRKDLDKVFAMLNRGKLGIAEIKQIWKAIKDATRNLAGDEPVLRCSAIELARRAGWGEGDNDVETRVKTAVSALEMAGYVKRELNWPWVLADSIQVSSMEEASGRITASGLFGEKDKEPARRIMQLLISRRSWMDTGDGCGVEVDCIPDLLGLDKCVVMRVLVLLRQEGLLSDEQDMSARLGAPGTRTRTKVRKDAFERLEACLALERLLLGRLGNQGQSVRISFREFNQTAQDNGISGASIPAIRDMLQYLVIQKHVQKPEESMQQETLVQPKLGRDEWNHRLRVREDVCRFLLEHLHSIEGDRMRKLPESDMVRVQFSLVGLHRAYHSERGMRIPIASVAVDDIEDALLYLSKIHALQLDGGFLVLHNRLQIRRLELDNRKDYTKDDYKAFARHYERKTEKVHIAGEYEARLEKSPDKADLFVSDYFSLSQEQFMRKYYSGKGRRQQLRESITPERKEQIFGQLSEKQLEVIEDKESPCIVVAAGPGSGKTRLLVHKLAALLLREEVKHEQLLMMTFTRAAATVFKKMLVELIGEAAHHVDVRTFHAYSLDLLGKMGSDDILDEAATQAAELIERGEAEPSKIAKTVLVIDEAQDMKASEYHLVRALMSANEDMRVIAVGDDDQSIYEFRGASPSYMRSFLDVPGSKLYQMTENFRSCEAVVSLANQFAHTLPDRMKSEDIRAVHAETGIVRIIHHEDRNLVQPVVDDVVKSIHQGEACVLASTNASARQIVDLLVERGVRARFLPNMSDQRFSLRNLAEVRFFLKQLDKRMELDATAAGIMSISGEAWNGAKEMLKRYYKESSCLENCLNLLRDFEETSGPEMYRSELQEFIQTSRYEDFYSKDRETVFVSTIHSAKGREFDQVYLLLEKDLPAEEDERRRMLRTIYVALTRAKHEMHVHCASDLFDGYQIPGVEHLHDARTYRNPRRITLPLTLGDVRLSFTDDNKLDAYRQRSGSPLRYDKGVFYGTDGDREVKVARIADDYARLEVKKWRRRGYVPTGGTVQFTVAWKEAGAAADVKEHVVVLPDMHFERK